MLGQIILVFVLVWILVLRWQRRHMISLSHKLSATKHRPLPLVGHAYLFLGSDEDRMTQFQKLGREAFSNDDGVITLWQGHRLYLVISDAKLAEFLLKTCLEKDDALKCLQLMTGNGSIFAAVNIWRPRRKNLAPTFSPKNLAHFVDIFSRQSVTMVEQLQAAVGREAFSIWQYITTYTMDSVCESTLGVSVNSQKQSEQPFLKAFDRCTQLDSARLCKPWLQNMSVYKMTPSYKEHAQCRDYIWNFVDEIIQSKKQSLKDEKVSMAESHQNMKYDGLKSFLELLMDNSGGCRSYTDVELREETLVLVLAGTDTSAVGTAFTTMLLARYPDVQEKVYQELQEVFGDSTRPIAAEDLPRLKYMDAVIRETLRLYPPVPIIARKVDKDVTLPSGITLVEDCGLVINIWALHRNPRYWGDDAEQFRPERFLEAPLSHPAAFMPFSYGPRACLGYQYAMMSMKTALSALLRQYRILPATTTEDMKPLRVKFDIMMRDVDNFTIKLVKRL
ncbi:hypothetical protein PYW08_015066 [Mythimna loreyi]|uniref:Uncharacterized protein n=1 Tax=Mythimna loreyi TaxID=667449 RepID=A0ACC2R486_9NEOP|nr:hypothetical protein PYW08_015066 [Mythimna loreyi]